MYDKIDIFVTTLVIININWQQIFLSFSLQRRCRHRRRRLSEITIKIKSLIFFYWLRWGWKNNLKIEPSETIKVLLSLPPFIFVMRRLNDQVGGRKGKKGREKVLMQFVSKQHFWVLLTSSSREKHWRKKISLHKSDASFPCAAASSVREQFGREDVFVCK